MDVSLDPEVHRLWLAECERRKVSSSEQVRALVATQLRRWKVLP